MSSEYEAERTRRIEQNKARMAELGVLAAKRALDAGTPAKMFKKSNSTGARPLREQNVAPTRVSRRVRNEAPEEFTVDDLARARELLEVTYAEEWYDDAHAEALGSAGETWELFRDGYDEQGRRIYDPVNGECCHQCRQKTKGLRTKCGGCGLMRGVYCGDCLWMRQGQNICEALANPEWRCPSCLDICNCSFCRTKKGYAPTGAMYRRVLAMGYDSVAHYLVLTNLRDEAKREKAAAEAAVKAEAFARREAENAAMRPDTPDSPEGKRPHWLQPKVYASE